MGVGTEESGQQPEQKEPKLHNCLPACDGRRDTLSLGFPNC